MSDQIRKLIQPALDEAGGMDVLNPATGASIAKVRTYTVEQIDAAIRNAEQARKAWAAAPAKHRSDLLRTWFERIMAHQEELAALCTAECGKPISESRGEVPYAASFVSWFAEEARRAYGETIPSNFADKAVLTVKEPVGTCAAITPWNFPLAVVTRKVAPALAAGCAMVVKPSEHTPLSALALEALAVEAGIPADIFRVLPSEDAAGVGALFCEHPVIRKISFTGSTRVGKLLLAQAAGTVKRVSMELGGNAPFIVFDDADMDAALDGLMTAKFRNGGQMCIGTNRVLLQDSIHDAFVERLVERVCALEVGNGAEERTRIGPLITEEGLRKVDRLTSGAVKQGANLLCGGTRHNAGPQFFTPTVLTGVTQDMEIANEEIFGPVATVLRFGDEAEAIRIANDTRYGLSAYVYSRDVGRIWRMMRALEFGMVATNDGVLGTEIAPFGGIKESGLGREGSRHGLDEYLEIKYALIGGLSG